MRPRFQDTTLGAWLIENSSVVALCVVRQAIFPTKYRKNLLRHFILNVLGGIWSTEGSILIQYLLVTRVYKHIPYFQKDESKLPKTYTNWKLALKDWLWCNGLTYFSLGWLTVFIERGISREDWDALATRRFSLFPFLAKLLLMRIVVDVGFYVRQHLPSTLSTLCAVPKIVLSSAVSYYSMVSIFLVMGRWCTEFCTSRLFINSCTSGIMSTIKPR